jgi:hypothetical protein
MKTMKEALNRSRTTTSRAKSLNTGRDEVKRSIKKDKREYLDALA